MKVLHVIPNLLKGGAQRLVIDICNKLIDYEEIECKLLVLSNSVNEFSFCSSLIDITFCKVEFQLSILKKNKIEISNYERFVDEYSPDVIHSHLYFAELVCHENTRKNIKYISHFHSNIPAIKIKTFKKLFIKKSYFEIFEKKRLLKKYLAAEKRYISISNNTLTFLRQNLSVKANKILKLENAFDYKRFYVDNKTASTKTIKLITVGNLLSKKNQIFLIEVVNYIESKYNNVHLNILGNGPEEKNIRSRIKLLKMEKHIKISGQIDLVEKELEKADFYVHSATYEPFGLVFLEAMAAKLPIISLDGKGNKDLIQHGINGFIYEDQNPVLFGDKILELFNDKQLYEAIFQEGLKTAKKYDISNYTKKLINIYNS